MDSGIFDLAAQMGQHRTRRSVADVLGGSTNQMSKKFKQRLGDLVNGQLKKTMSSKAAGQTASKLTSRLLLEHPQYLTDPEVMTVAEVLLGLKSPDQLDPIIIADVLKVSVSCLFCWSCKKPLPELVGLMLLIIIIMLHSCRSLVK